MTDINLKTLTPDTSLPTTGFLFGADSQASTNPSVYSTQTVATTLLGSTSLTSTDPITTSAPLLNLTQAWNSSGTTFTGLRFNVDTTTYNQSAAASLLMDLQVGTVSRASITKDAFFTLKGIAAEISIGYTAETNLRIQQGGVIIPRVGGLFFSSSSTAVSGGNIDTYITRSTKNTGANLQLGGADAAAPVAQTLSVQSVVAGATNNPAGADFTITGSQGLGSGAGGSIIFKVAPAGSPANPAQNALADALTIASTKQVTLAGDLALYSSNTLRIGSSTVNWQIVATTTGIIQGSVNYYGFYDGTNLASGGSTDTRLYRDAAGVLGVRGTSTSVGAALSFIEQTAPASPAANIVRIYAEDNGSGKTRLMALFATGVAQQIAIEP
jgi:hypothetical protein